MEFLWMILVGAVAGWLGSLLFKGSGSGLLLNIILGIVGGFVGGWLFGLLGFATTGLIGQIIAAAVGAFIVLFVVNLIKK